MPTFTDVNGIIWNYTLDGSNNASIGNNAFSDATTLGTGLSGLQIIPSTVNGYTVTSINPISFFSCSSLTSVTIPDSVTSIQTTAFYGCTGLTSVTIGISVKSIGVNCFSNCTSLTSVAIPFSVTTIDDGAFNTCSGLTSVTIGNSVTIIGSSAFNSCNGLTSVTIGTSVTSIGDYAFGSCSVLTSLTIPNSVTSIGEFAISYCGGLTSVKIGKKVTTIGGRCFRGCYSLTSINIPDSVTSIGIDAFRETSTNLTVTMNTGKFGITSPSTNRSFFSGSSVDFVLPPPPPTIIITSTTPGVTSGSTTNNTSIALTFTSTESTSNFAGDDITLTNGSLFSSFAGNGTDGKVYTAIFTPAGQGLCTIDVSANKFTNAAGEDNAAANTFTWTFDSVSPSMTITSTTTGVTSGSTTNNTFIELTFTSNEATNNFTVGDISVTNGALSNFAGIGTDGLVYNATFTPTGPGACTIGVGAGVYTDAATNLNNLATQFNWTFYSDYGIPTNSGGPPYIPTPLSFVDNRLTIADTINATDTDVVSFQLTAGNRLYPLSVSSFSGSGTVTYSLDISGGTNVKSGTFTSAGTSLLPGDGSVTVSVNTTYILTMTANAAISYTIIGYLDYGIPQLVGYNFSAALTQQILSASNLQTEDFFGHAVAISGDYAIVGATQEDGSSIITGWNSGAAYIFERDSSGIWSEKQILRASNANDGDSFGNSVAISGNYAIIGANLQTVANSGAAYIFERDGSGNWIEKSILQASNAGSQDRFGGSVAISGNYAIVGAAFRLTNDSGAAYIFERDVSGNWNQKPMLTASNLGATDNFGYSVAISGNYAIVGAWQEDGSNNITFDCGAAYIFERSIDGTWSETKILRINNDRQYVNFGNSIAISGNYAIIGAYLDDGTTTSTTSAEYGAAYIFERDGSGNWNPNGILRASNAGLLDSFGYSVAISGNYAVVGVKDEDGSNVSTSFNSGAAYIFERDGSGNWTEKNIIRNSNQTMEEYFGNSVAISGNTILVGGYRADIISSSIYDSGAAYFYSANPIYTYTPKPLSFVNSTLTITNSIDATDTDKVSFELTARSSLYLFSVTSFSGTGTVSYSLDISGGANIKTGTFSANNFDLLTGTALTASENTTYILTLTANAAITYTIVGLLDYGIKINNIWASPTETILRASNFEAGDNFGVSVAISGNYAIVGTPFEDGSSTTTTFNSGAAYIFERDNSGMMIEKILRASNLDENDQFGTSVAISGNYAIVGAHYEDGSGNEYYYSGAAYVFERDSSGNWIEKTILRASNIGTGDYFGYSVAISGNYAVVGAWEEDGINDSKQNTGAAYIFERISGNWIETKLIRASDSDVNPTNIQFGYSVAISGNYVIVGAPETGSLSDRSGSAYIFERNGSGNWIQNPIILKASNYEQNDRFGERVAISGNYAIIGAWSEDGSSNQASNSGAAYIFERDGSGNWTEKRLLRASNFEAGDRFGQSVAISGNYAIVGANQEDGTNTKSGINFNSGAAYVFERDGSGNWAETKILRANNARGATNFGESVAIDGNYAIVGASQDPGSSNYEYFGSGSAYIYAANVIDPTPLTFVDNTLTISNSIDAADTDVVSFSLTAGSSLYPFSVTSFSGTGTISYSLAISGGANVKFGTFSAANFDLLAGVALTASGNTTYILTLTANAAITYTLVGSILTPPTNIALSNNSVNELQPVGTTIGTLSCNNTNTSLITYSVSDTTRFSITGSTLKTNAIFDFETASSYVVTITASIAGVTSSNSITIFVTNISGEAAELRRQNLQGAALKTVADSQGIPITATELRDVGYNLIELKSAVYNATQLKAAAFTATELKDVSFNAIDLKTALFTATELKDASFNVIQLKDASFNATELKTALFTATELKDASFNVIQLKDASFNATELKTALFTATELKTALFTATELKDASFNAIQLKDASFNATELKTALFTANELKDASFNAIQLKDASFTATELKDASFNVIQLKDALFTANELKTALFTATELKDASFNLIQLKDASFTATELKDASFNAIQLKDALFTATELKNALFTATELKDASFNAIQLKDASFTATELKDASFNLIQLRDVSFNATELKNALFTATELKDASFNLIQLKDASFTATELKDASFNAIQLKDVSFNATELKNALFTATELKDASFNLIQLKDASFTATELKDASFNAIQLKDVSFNATELKTALFTATELKDASFTATDLKDASFNATQLKDALFNATDLKTALFTVTELEDVGFTAAELDYGIFMDPTPLSFVNNTLTMTDRIDTNDTDAVSFELTAGDKLYPFGVTSFIGTGIVTYTLDISGGANVITGIFSAANVDLLEGTPVTASGNTTYILTLTSNAAITYTIVAGILISPTNIILSNNSVNELQPIGTTIGKLSCDNPNNAFIAYSVSDTTRFSITGSTLKTNVIFDYETTSSYVVTITASIGGLTSSSSMTIFVTNISGEAAELRRQNLQGPALKTAADSQGTPVTTTDLKAAGYDATDLKAAVYTATQLKDASFNATELKTALFTATELKDASFNAIQLKDASFNAIQLKDASFNATELKTALFTATELKTALFNVIQLKDASFNATELKTALFTATELKDASFNATELKTALFTATELKDASFNATELKTALFTATELKDASFNVIQLKDASFNATELKTALFTATELKDASFNLIQLKDASFNATELKTALFTATELKDASFNVIQLKDASFNATELKTALFTATELKTALFTASELKDASFNATELKTAAYTATEMKSSYSLPELIAGAYNPAELKDAAYTVADLTSSFSLAELKSGGYTATEMKSSYSLPELIAGAYNPTELKAAAYTVADLTSSFSLESLKTGGYTAAEMKSSFPLAQLIGGGYNSTELKAAAYTVAEMASNGISIESLKTGGYTVPEMTSKFSFAQLKTGGFTAAEMKTSYSLNSLITGGYNATELKAAAYTAAELKSKFTLEQLKIGGYTATEMKIANFPLAQLKASGYTVAQMTSSYTLAELKSGGYTAAEISSVYSLEQLIDAGYNSAELKAAGYTVTNLKSKGFSLESLKTGGYTAAEMKSSYTLGDLVDGGYAAAELKAAAYTVADLTSSFSLESLKTGGYTAAEMKSSFSLDQLIGGGYNAVDLKAAAYTVTDLTVKGFSLEQLKSGGYTPTELISGYSFTDLKTGGYTAAEMKSSYSLDELIGGGYTAVDLKSAAYTVSELTAKNFTFATLKSGGYTATEMDAIYSLEQLIDGGYTAGELKSAAYTAADLIEKGFGLSTLKAGGYTAIEMKSIYSLDDFISGGYNATELRSAAYNVADLNVKGFNLATLKAGGYTVAEMISVFSFEQLKSGGYSAAEMKAAGYSLADLKTGGYNAAELKSAEFTASQLKNANFTIDELKTGGYTAAQMKVADYNATELKTIGYTAAQMKDALYSAAELNSLGYTPLQLVDGGFNSASLLISGIMPDWNVIENANCLTTSFVQDFIDVSGSIILRENANLYVNGNVEIGGDLLLNRLVVAGDANFSRSIFVGGDVSMNGKQTAHGDLSMNGTVTKCSFNNSSIPKSAFAAAVPDGPNYTTTRIVYDQTFQSNADVSMNGTTVAANNVKVSGNIVFGDGTVMNAYDNNVLIASPKVFKSSTFTRLDICGNLVAGSYATSSDYRIKTNIVELDETYTVDKLRPVKYYQTQINREKYGLIAHELQEHYPDLVVGEKDGSELQRINYMGLIAILINDIKRLKLELTEIETNVVIG